MEKLENQNILEIICNDEEETIKQKLKQLLVTICYGKEQEELEIISFDETIEELNKRIERKTDEQKAGMIGELLFHLKSFEKLKNYSNISIYLNREERSVKKGFDVLLFDGKKVWYTEVKSRENAQNENITDSHVSKIQEAITDVKGKFSSNNKNYWLTAKSNIANVEEKELKKQIADILTKEIDEQIEKNAIGVSAVFKKDIDNIDKKKVKKVLDREKNNFKNIVAVCISHEDYKKMVKILKELENGTKL
jgi:hypothetical protein